MGTSGVMSYSYTLLAASRKKLILMTTQAQQVDIFHGRFDGNQISVSFISDIRANSTGGLGYLYLVLQNGVTG